MKFVILSAVLVINVLLRSAAAASDPDYAQLLLDNVPTLCPELAQLIADFADRVEIKVSGASGRESGVNGIYRIATQESHNQWGVPTKPVSTPLSIGNQPGHHTIENRIRRDPAFSAEQLTAFESIPYYYLWGNGCDSSPHRTDNGQTFRWPEHIMYFECDRHQPDDTFEGWMDGDDFKKIYSRLGEMRGRWVIRKIGKSDHVYSSGWMNQDDSLVKRVLCEMCSGTELPTGWEIAHSPDGTPYYWKTETQETQWERPSGSCEACDGSGDIYMFPKTPLGFDWSPKYVNDPLRFLTIECA